MAAVFDGHGGREVRVDGRCGCADIRAPSYTHALTPHVVCVPHRHYTKAAHFCARHMAEAVRTAPGYATGDFQSALKNAFAAVDAALCSPSGREDMMQLAMDTQDSCSVAAAAARAQVRWLSHAHHTTLAFS